MNARRLAVWIAAAAALAALPEAYAASSRVARPSRVAIIDTERRLDVGQINLRVRNDGMIGYDPDNGAAGLEYPKGSARFAIYAAGLWLTAKVGAEMRGALAQYETEYGPGVMVQSLWTDPLHSDYRVYKMARWSGDPQDSAQVMRNPAEIASDPNLDPLLHHGWSEYIARAAPYGAPVRTYRLPVTVTLDPADSVDVLGPDVQGDQMLWCVYNDADPAKHVFQGGETAPLAIEVHQTVYSYQYESTVFVRYQLINKGVNLLDSLLIGFWADPDVGSSFDDRIGSDSALALVYVYNGHYQDVVYGTSPPALGLTLPRSLAGIPSAYAFTGPLKPQDPQNIVETRHQMLGLENDGLPKRDPEGNPSRYWFSGDAAHGTGWLDPTLADRRMLITVGPVTMAPGDTQTVEVVIKISQGTDNLSSVAKLLCETEQMMAPYLPNPPDIVCLDSVAQSCPRDVAFWQEQCASLSPNDLLRIAQCVDESSTVLSWPGMEEFFCANINSTAHDPFSEVHRQLIVFLANVCAAKLGIVPISYGTAFLGPGIEMWSRTVGARTVAEMAAPATTTPCHCADSLLSAVTLLPQDDPVRLEAYRVIATELSAVNHGFGLGPTCAEAQGALPSLVSAMPTDNGVEATWNTGSAGDVLAAVERLDGGVWTEHWQGFPIAGMVAFTDPDAEPGQIYHYRIVINPDGREQAFAAAEVVTPAGPDPIPLSFGVKVIANPGELVQLVLSTPSNGPATVELFDLNGRLIERQHSKLTPGHTTVSIGGPSLGAGIYLVRVRQGARSSSAKAVIVR